jgi:hypothetical protein
MLSSLVFQDAVVARGEGSWDKLVSDKAVSLKSFTQLKKMKQVSSFKQHFQTHWCM